MEAVKTVATNRKARYNYHIDETMEAGIMLTGTEIKSVRAGKVSLAQSFARPARGELWLLNAHIALYESGNRHNHEPTRPRKLLMHRDEIDRVASITMEKRVALVPLRLYLKKGLAKVELGLAKGKKLYDKRESIARRQTDREIERTLKTRRVQR
ncbi:MAG: SsrA-binding protein SmpB [Chloroflexi bacterium]|nr:SsrA-binding protein SmpB [Chloroflexota bacterium]